MSHMTFVLLSYGFATAIVGALIGWLWTEARATRGELTRLESQGVKRRSKAS